MKISSDFALIDIKIGREELAARLMSGERIEIILKGEVISITHENDGISTMFEVSVLLIKEVSK